ncbi:MAG TPA: ferredoxin-thioredoxin reductase catalytic domain-containing protein [Spirochaetia bacterium]|nr:ferredoxin-thioredoxin reductase catalytic domain-containing protein [Spirochaetia bacterium]
MKSKIHCPVCQVGFLAPEGLQEGDTVICPVCGALLTVGPPGREMIEAAKTPQAPWDEISQRVDNFARLRHYIFQDTKDLVMEGLMQKKETYGDFYCPCRLENVPENLCPCLETRMNRVLKEGNCRCGLFWKE